ncbi:hypothetical protein CHUV2995_01026 [Corynebacterium diphtheriae subsp. lausannense]|nr:hypothetical protein FRC0043_01840 [Corynebacterium belfantii]SPJ40235.1 hypothetical protein CHUV2995_01026 [Corynebacterium diphtheriae subsp. lausannense]STC66292.1 Uncharacterised protein [Corynebacterium diphtheriae]
MSLSTNADEIPVPLYLYGAKVDGIDGPSVANLSAHG